MKRPKLRKRFGAYVLAAIALWLGGCRTSESFASSSQEPIDDQRIFDAIGTSSGSGDEINQLSMVCLSPPNVDDLFYVAIYATDVGTLKLSIVEADYRERFSTAVRRELMFNGEFHILYSGSTDRGSFLIDVAVERRDDVTFSGEEQGQDRYYRGNIDNRSLALPSLERWQTHCKAYPGYHGS